MATEEKKYENNNYSTSELDTEVNNYYDKLKNQSYRTMLEGEIQASIAKDQALKYTQNALKNQGIGNQGIAQSTIAGINNTYQNGLSQAAAQYQQSLMDYAGKELDYKLNRENTEYTRAFEREKFDFEKQKYADQLKEAEASRIATEQKNNFETTDELIGGYLKYEGNNIVDADINNIERVLNNIGGVKTDNGYDLSKANLDESSKKILEEEYKLAKDVYDKNLEAERKKQEEVKKYGVEINNKDVFNNGTDVVKFTKSTEGEENGSGLNYNFTVRDSSGKTTEWEMGAQYTSYPNRINKNQIDMDKQQHKIGDIWLSNNGDYLALVLKDQKGKVRMVEGTVNTKGDENAIIGIFNRYGNLGLEKLSYTTQEERSRQVPVKDENGNEVKDKDGNIQYTTETYYEPVSHDCWVDKNGNRYEIDSTAATGATLKKIK